MGGGPRRKDDVARASSETVQRDVDRVAQLLADTGGLLAGADNFCAAEHELSFELLTRNPPPVGSAIALADDHGLLVMFRGRAIGVVDDAAAEAIRTCLLLEWTMAGAISSLDPLGASGVVRVSGK
jgi:hypothetical protein